MDTNRSGTEYKSQVLAATELVELVGKTVSLKKRGKNYLGLCPFHSEKSPSFNVDPVKQFFHCFGCKESGDAITFVMKRDRIAFLDALHQLGDAANIDRPSGSGYSKEKAGEKQRLLDAQSAAAAFFQRQLAHPTAGAAGRNYLDSRGFNPAAIGSFQIGQAADAWDAMLRSPDLKAFPPPLLAAAGLVKPRDGGNGFYDTFRNRIMFPIRDENGRVIAFGGRVMPGSADKAKYLNSPETALFSKSRCVYGLDLARQKIVESRTVAVVEGYADVVMAHQFGATNVVSVLGTALTESHVSILRRFADRIVLLFDADNAGDTAVNRAVELFLTQPVEVAIASLPDGVDPDEFLLAHGAEAFDGILKNAADALTFKWKQLVGFFNANGNDMTGQQKAVRQYMELLAGARGSGPVDPMRWGSALSRVSRLTDIPVEELNRMFRPKPAEKKKFGPVKTEPVNADSVPVVHRANLPLNARDRAERWILSVLLAQPHRWSDVMLKIGPDRFVSPTHRRMAEVYWQHQRDEGEPVFAEFLGTLEPGLKELAVELVEEFETLGEVDDRLNESLEYMRWQQGLENSAKQVADLRRKSVAGGGEPSDEVKNYLRQLSAAADARKESPGKTGYV